MYSKKFIEKSKDKANGIQLVQQIKGRQQISGFVDNRPEVTVQRKLQENGNKSSDQKYGEVTVIKVVQRSPTLKDDGSGNYFDPNYPGMVLTVNKEKSDEYLTFYNATNISNPATVYYQDGQYFDEEENSWYPLYLDRLEDGGRTQNCYICRSFHNIVDINDINFMGVGNEQEWKKKELRKSIRGGILQAIQVRNAEGGRYDLVNGRNRVAVSIEAGYRKIPIEVVE